MKLQFMIRALGNPLNVCVFPSGVGDSSTVGVSRPIHGCSSNIIYTIDRYHIIIASVRVLLFVSHSTLVWDGIRSGGDREPSWYQHLLFWYLAKNK